MNRDKSLILKFSEIGIVDVPLVGGKNAALGELFNNLTSLGINVPDGFAITAEAYRLFMNESGLNDNISAKIKAIDSKSVRSLQKAGKEIRKMILNADISENLRNEVRKFYTDLIGKYGDKISVAVRSSATAEDLPDASFAGQQETYLNVLGFED